MRTLETPPRSVVEANGAMNIGSFRGSLPRVDLRPLGKNVVYRLTHQKRWIYTAIATSEIFVGLAVVDLGYAKNTFAFVYRKGSGMLADRSVIGHPVAGGVADGINTGLCANFSTGRTRIDLHRRGDLFEVDAVFDRELEVHARLDAHVAHPALSAIGPIPAGVINATEKQALLPVTGEVIVRGDRHPLDGALGGWDYTNGYLARHTQWRWAYLLGRAKSGERVGVNLVEGFLGERECGVWIDDTLHPIGEGRFEFSRNDPTEPWRIRSTDGALDLHFTPGAMHAERTDFKVIRSKFVQPVGSYRGVIAVGGKRYEVEDVLGVAEDQDVLW